MPTAVRVAFLLSQGGEFGFVVFGAAKALGMTTLWPNIVALAVIATVYFALSVVLLPKPSLKVVL